METKANYILIGLFTIAGALGLLGFFLWFARIELDRQFAYYDIRFTSVAGLSAASDVRFSGLPVGQVVDVDLSPEGDGTITVRVEVAADTPVRTDSIATIEAQGVTGVAFVGIGPGTPDAPLLRPTSDRDVPEIEAGRSVLQSLSEDAPELVSETLLVVQQVGDLFRGENAQRLERILANAEQASGELATTLEGFSGVAGTVDQFTAQISRFNTTLDTLTRDLAVVLRSADETLISIDLLADQATGIVASGTNTLDSVQGVVTEAERYIAEDLTLATSGIEDTLTSLREELALLRSDASALMVTLGATGETATQRLAEAEETLVRANTLLATLDSSATAVEATATRIDGFIEGEGTALVAETRQAVVAATEVIDSMRIVAETDLPLVVSDIRAAVENAREVLDRVGTDLETATSGVADVVATAETTMTQVTETFANANTTLTAINGALETGERTLVAAESAFTGADALINEDLSGLVAELTQTVEGLSGAVGEVSDDLPAITADIRAASQVALDTFARLQTLVDGAEPGVREFTTTSLPLFARLAQETRTLIANLDRLTQQIGRDPARFLLNQDVPEFRR
ncbi:MCE family protein [Roseicyclus elongatus]|uniref:MCE family protein n=1 Tax=Roseicyclus elongatus TaxID=159346 RepID=UPI00046C90CD|nr:MlaD family protein [Roseibacterium elongatum]